MRRLALLILPLLFASVGAILFRPHPSAPKRVHAELQQALADRGFSSITQAVSYAHRPSDPTVEETDFDFISE